MEILEKFCKFTDADWIAVKKDKMQGLPPKCILSNFAPSLQESARLVAKFYKKNNEASLPLGKAMKLAGISEDRANKLIRLGEKKSAQFIIELHRVLSFCEQKGITFSLRDVFFLTLQDNDKALLILATSFYKKD